MAKMNVTEKDFEAFFQATESLMAMSCMDAIKDTGSRRSVELYRNG